MSGDLQGRVFLVTGATEGIGKAAAREFAKRGAELALVARDMKKGERVVAELKKATGNNDISLLVADMSSLADIKRIAAEFRASRTKLDVLVNNAGALFKDYQLSKDGLEMTFALNHMGYFGLTYSLLRSPEEHERGARRLDLESGAQNREVRAPPDRQA